MILTVEAFIYRSTEYDKTEPKMSLHTRYSEIVADVIGIMEQCTCGEEDLSSLECMLRKFKKIFIEAFDNHCDSGL